MTKIKICGLFRPADIEAVNQAQPDYIGFILNFPKSHRNVDADTAGYLASRRLPGIQTVGVFVDQPLGTVVDMADRIGLDIIQLHGHEDETYIRDLRSRTNCEIWKAFRVRSEEELEPVERCMADMVLLDSGYGSGKTFDWSMTAHVQRPYILAGGLTPENIPEAISRLSPAVLDVSSGVETDRIKDAAKIRAAVRAAHADRGQSME
ncbi:MAG: phosphoribosylanthranilate isomerase [Clostridia bacterium]|nr:phosphoribosylanthranilate isomerase [Clostridia bacterium]